jgi:hypothetical protein
MDPQCIVPTYLAYMMSIYVSASIYYLLKTRTIGTPFRDSLTEEQLVIKAVVSEVRGRIFLNGVILSGILLLYFRPFAGCSCINR